MGGGGGGKCGIELQKDNDCQGCFLIKSPTKRLHGWFF